MDLNSSKLFGKKFYQKTLNKLKKSYQKNA